MVDDPASQFSAAPSALGYLYQFRYALLATLRRLREEPEFQISIETLDDVVFAEKGQPASILQTKHHQERAASLADASPDLWKTLRIWSGLVRDGVVSSDVSLILITTSSATAGHATSYLRDSKRDCKKALERLCSTAQTSTNKENASAYAAFQSLTDEQRADLLAAIVVVDNAPDIGESRDQLLRELRWSAPSEHLDSFTERLEGWWFGRAIRALQQPAARPILSSEVDNTVSDLREQFKSDNLPIDEDILGASVQPSVYADHVFVHQLRLFDASSRRIVIAMREYFRAFEHRSRWVREDLLLVGELEKYERRLVEEWEIHFIALRDELGDASSETEMKKAAARLYKWVETQASFPIRSGCTEPFVTRGSYQMLSDKRRVGWHLHFEDRLRELLEGQEVTK